MKKIYPFMYFATSINLLLLGLSLLSLFSCVQPTATRTRSLTSSSTSTGPSVLPTTPVIDPAATPATPALLQRVELSHFVDPFDGTYKKKVTIPKNFKGSLYLAGLNVSSLVDKLVAVRFNFGVEKQSVILKATIARAPGIIPKTDIQVLVIDMNSAPFKNMRLTYDLYDYNDYTTDPTKDIVSDPRDGGLYCRGLALENDPTFIPVSDTSTCSGLTDKCLYSYAKIVDATLYDNRIIDSVTRNISSLPTRVQVWSEGSGVRSPSAASMAGTSCLPDDKGILGINELFNLNLGALFNGLEVMPGYFYHGPFRSINDTDWQIKDNAIYNTSGLGIFQDKTTLSGVTLGYQSMLFPRSGKISLNPGVSYLGSAAKTGPRSKIVLVDPSGATQYVDGCNIRTQNIDPATNEGISSCTVNASIEVFYMLDGKETIVVADNSIKLQIIRSSINYQGKEVLATAFKRCESSSTCNSNECCFNSRCWSKDLVTQCVDQTPVIGNQEIGANCSSDFECSSLCCNQSSGSCAPHNPNGSTQLFCSKASGQQCVSKEFCKQEAVVTCSIVKSGLDINGIPSCTLRCPAVMTYGDCVQGRCVPPPIPAIPAFDPNNCPK